MKQGYLSQYFYGVAMKHLSAVETDLKLSHQHEFNGVKGLKSLLGEPEQKTQFNATFLYMDDENDNPLVEEGFLTWYDSRQKARNERSIMRWEYRLYFSDNLVTRNAGSGDFLVIAKQSDQTLLAIVAKKDTTIEKQLMWLFDFHENDESGFSVKSGTEYDNEQVGIAARVVLEYLGIEVEEDAPGFLEQMISIFHGGFPKAFEFSEFARGTLHDVSGLDDPDAALIAWMEQEEVLFRTLEKHLLLQKLQEISRLGIEDPEPVIKVVQSALQRRKSRAGSALENHLEYIFIQHGLTYTRGGVTENNVKPDFIFPDISCYHNREFPTERLTMLASKSTCKDRWRQILNEAERIPYKHLLTLEPSISMNQTNEMDSMKSQRQW